VSGHWNYRMTVQTVDGEEEWAVRELYYGADGTVQMWSQNPEHPRGETLAELRLDMDRYTDALNRPALDLDTKTWRTPATVGAPPEQPELFEPVPGSHKGRVRCTVCGTRGYPGGRWQEPHRRGHGSCPRCGGMQTLKLNGSARTHAHCPKREAP
jgi:hypothetical protein